jgi:hypothetical protein
VLEGISRIILSKVYNRKFDSSLIEENKYGSSAGLKANATGMVWGKAFHTDDMGGRRTTKKKEGKPKLLVIGDSVTEGVGVDDSATFVNIFNSGNVFDDKDIRNVSLIGWSCSDYRNVADHLIGKDTSIKGLCLFYCLNDIYGKTSVKNLPAIGNSGFMSKLNAILQDRYATYKLIKLVAYQNSDRYYQYDQALYRDTNKVKATMVDLIHIKSICDRNGVSFAVFIMPYRSQLYKRYDNLPQRILTTELRKNYIQYVDLLTLWPIRSSYNDLYLFGDEIHLSHMGHRAVADAIFHK